MTSAQTKAKGRGLENILPILREELPELRRQHNIKALGVFGSWVRGEQQRRSDLDLLVEFDEAPTFFQFVRLERRLSELLSTKVDLVMKSALRPGIRQQILDEVVPVEA